MSKRAKKDKFLWAQGKEANVQEPMRELTERGWQKRDIPKASNVNWIFKQISDDLGSQREDIEKLISEMGQQKTKLKQDITQISAKMDRENTALKKEIAGVSKKVGAINRGIKSMTRNFSELRDAFCHILPVLVQVVDSVNNKRESLFNAEFPFRYKKEGQMPHPIIDLRLK